MKFTESDPILERPIMVIGAARSGTTVLGNMLGSHPDLALLVEPRLTWQFGNESRTDFLRAEHAKPRIRAHIRAKFAEFGHSAGGRRIVEKTPSNSVRMGFVEAIFPDCRFVHIIRNGLDSVLSTRQFWTTNSRSLKTANMATRLKEMDPTRLPHYAKELARRVAPNWLRPLVGKSFWGVHLPGLSDLQTELDLTAVCALQWRACVEAACQYGRSLPAGRYMECRLEDLSLELLERIADFCEIETPESILETYAERFSPSRSDSQQKSASRDELDEIMRWIEPTMKWLGYA